MIPHDLMIVFQWLIRSSIAGTVLLGVILLIRVLVRRQLHFRMVYWLWMLLLLRLIWPLNLQTTFSVFNLIPRQIESNRYLSAPPAEATYVDASPVSNQSSDMISNTPMPFGDKVPGMSDADNHKAGEPISTAIDPMYFLCVIWLVGTGVLAGWIVYNNFRLWNIVRHERLVTQQDILELLEDCKRQLGLQTVIGIVATDRVKTPCLFGYLRPLLLLPEGILQQMDRQQLRYVFLHELGHLKRHDILIGWLMAVVQVLHWFNPAVWFAMSRIDRDRELACDELALSRLEENETKEYGATILTFLQHFARQQKLPAMAGIAENQSLLKRRITMIAQFKNKKMSWMPISVIVVIAIMLVATTFTSAQTESQTATTQKPLKTQIENTPSSKPEMLALDDGKSAGRESIAGGGHIQWFETDGGVELLGIRIYGSRYGTPQPPKENFYVWIANENQDVVETFEFPYATIKRGNPKWYMLKTKPTVLPKEFYLCVGFNPEQTKGVYVHYDGEAGGHSYIGLPHDNFEFKPFDRGDWMIRAVVRPAAMKEAASGGLQSIIDAAEPGTTIEIPAGTYEEPVTINKSLILKGESREDCIFKVTADQPAVFIDTKGGRALLENVTIQWQLATSEQHETPFAVAVKDTTAEIKNCVFRPLGDSKRSPVAVRSMGFSDMRVTDCDFTGFDYVVCYGEGTKGKIQGCFIRDCGHQGVILYSGAQADVIGNIITGSKFHAVRTTGGELNMRDNLIINNRNRGVYLGNKSGSGRISNNLLIGNASGIDGVSACRFSIENNVILKSTYAAIAVRPYSKLAIRGNVLMSNPRGIVIHQQEGKSDPIQSKFAQNVYWKNQTDVENCEKGEGAMDIEPEFIDAANGNFKISDPQYGRFGLSDPETIYYLWKKYKEKM